MLDPLISETRGAQTGQGRIKGYSDGKLPSQGNCQSRLQRRQRAPEMPCKLCSEGCTSRQDVSGPCCALLPLQGGARLHGALLYAHSSDGQEEMINVDIITLSRDEQGARCNVIRTQRSVQSIRAVTEGAVVKELQHGGVGALHHQGLDVAKEAG